MGQKIESPIGKLIINGGGLDRRSNVLDEKSDVLDGKIFVIPFYQRGYRWTANEATKLFMDLVEFSRSNENEYCLQPIVLQEVEKQGSWKNFPSDSKGKAILRVVDGQQRLTTIAILLSVLDPRREWKWDIYYLAEQNTLSELLAPESGQPKTINDLFRKAVKDAFDGCNEKEKEAIKKLFCDSSKSVSFLRYDIPNNPKNDPEGHSAFLRLNGGKTPLTSSELIRALYMVNASGLDDQERMEISKEWEIIEDTLRDEQFWLMFNSKGLSSSPTRIDLLFALVMGVSLENAKANPRIVFETLDEKTAEWDLLKVWHNVLRCFWWMKSCHSDMELFNYLCWIHEFTDNSAKTIYDKWRSYPKPEDFKKSVMAIIQEKYRGKSLDYFTYDSDKSDLRALFVLLNLLECNHNKERFRFDLYKNESWDIEHIDSQTPNELSKPQDQIAWLESSYIELPDNKKEKFRKKFPVFKENNIILSDYAAFKVMADGINELWYGKQVEQGENNEKFDKNAIGNLALLNTSINRSYKNAIFPVKRRVIKDFIGKGKCYVPPCTAKAFMKFYTESPSKITHWLQADFDGYSSQMENYFDDFMKLSSELPDTPKPSVQKDADKFKKSSSELPDAVSFIDFMDKYHVVIPKIQRLYVQGRLDSHGKKCLSSFAGHLVECIVSQKECPLDFIYGIDGSGGDEKEFFYPLDGQQRLTTLLLLAWLCGVTSGVTKGRNWLFTYDSRRAAECFIEGLLQSDPPPLEKHKARKDSLKGGKDYLPLCSGYINKSDWFLSAWKEDAGIAGMLEMLDSLYGKLLDKLPDSGKTQFDFSKITFFVNYLDAARKSYDQIFLKMNSRGKPLTAWENVKAVLDRNAPGNDWQEKINNTWPELLWKKLPDCADKIGSLDSKMLSVVELALACAGYKEKTKDNTFQLAQWLEKKKKEEKNEKSKVEFYWICTIFFSALCKGDDAKGCLGEALKPPAWEGKKEVDPRWPDFTKDTPEEFYKPLLAFYAAKQSDNVDWMRVVWNIVENAGITRQNFPDAYRLISELSGHAVDILTFLAGDDDIKSQFARSQLAEERAKAKKMAEGDDWKTKIIEAENYAFFHGAIRFLFTGENGEVDWSQFDRKFENAQEYFDKDGVQDNYKNEAKLLRRLLSLFDKWEHWWKLAYDSSKENWHDILLNKELQAPVHKLLSQNDVLEYNFADYEFSLVDEKQKFDEKQKYLAEFLVREKALTQIPGEGWRLRWRNWNGGCYDIDPYRQGNRYEYFVIHRRNELLSALKEQISLVDSKSDLGCKFIIGKNILFTYQNYKFYWDIERNDKCAVYLLEDGKKKCREQTDGGQEEKSEEEKYCCFNVENEDYKKPEKFIKKLNQILTV